jgi:uncharacterized membrane protein
MLSVFLLGFSSGLRTMTAPAIVAWTVRSGWPGLESSALWWMAAPVTAYILTLFAVGELVADKLPFIPSRLAPGPLIGRIVSGGLCGATLAAAAGGSLAVNVVLGGIAAVVGATAGYRGRRRMSSRFPDIVVAVVEDLVAIGLAVAAVSVLRTSS